MRDCYDIIPMQIAIRYGHGEDIRTLRVSNRIACFKRHPIMVGHNICVNSRKGYDIIHACRSKGVTISRRSESGG
jgi:hypothetical protein